MRFHEIMEDMKIAEKLIIIAGVAVSAASCTSGTGANDGGDGFRYLIDEFADLKQNMAAI